MINRKNGLTMKLKKDGTQMLKIIVQLSNTMYVLISVSLIALT